MNEVTGGWKRLDGEEERLFVDGILDWQTGKLWPDWASAKAAGILPEKRSPMLGMILHRSSWQKRELFVEGLLKKALNDQGIALIALVMEGGSASLEGSRSFPELIKSCLMEDGRLQVQGLVNRMVFVGNGGGSEGMYEQVARFYNELGVPVFQPISTYFCTEKDYKASAHPLREELPWSYITPEFQGNVEPMLIALRDDQRRILPLEERIVRYAKRIAAHLRLASLDNEKKRVVLMLHNSPCSGVEATVGVGHELQVLESAVNILRELDKEGYQIGSLPKDGEQLKEWFFEKKAYSDFRWTNVEQIAEAGGILYRMPLSEYERYYRELSVENRTKLESLYGPPPGEGMVLENELVLTGLALGNVLVVLEPKRGCYGSKCTGEVCKILQDPHCPPPHQYLACFWYLRYNWKADALLHLGTHGSMEFLPGKSSAPSVDCWPDIAVGELPVFYLYHSNVPGEALTAKRRAYSALISHLPATGGKSSPWQREMQRLLLEWEEAKAAGAENEALLLAEIRAHLEQELSYRQMVGEAGEEEGLRLLGQYLKKSPLMPGNWHVWGKELEEEEIISYVLEVWSSEAEILEELAGIFGKEDPLMGAAKALEQLFAGKEEHRLSKALAEDALSIREALILSLHGERKGLLDGLSGSRIWPGCYGGPDQGGRKVLPTGRNLYTMDEGKIPTKTAYDLGRQLAHELLEHYRQEEGHWPEQVAINMISQDITRCRGIQMGQLFSLIGIRPRWDESGNVQGLCLIPTEELGRPRIDVTLRISGVLRDSWPQAVALMDEGIFLAASAQEPPEENFLHKHTLELLKKSVQRGEAGEEAAYCRIFGDPPGAFGAGVDLALKASAWNEEKDLARYFAQFSAYAYGRKLSGKRMAEAFVFHAGHTDITCDHTSSKRYDVLAAGFSAEVQGGFKLAAEHLGGRSVRQYQGNTDSPGRAELQTLKAAIQECAERTLFNPVWKEQMMARGYQGAAEMMHRLQNVFTWQCVNEAVGDELVDRLVEEYVLSPQMQEFFKRENPFAMEEIARRFLELHTRNKWTGDSKCLQELKEHYLEAEGDLEDQAGEAGGEWQGGSVEIIADDQVETWKERLSEIDALFQKGGVS